LAKEFRSCSRQELQEFRISRRKRLLSAMDVEGVRILDPFQNSEFRICRKKAPERDGR
jgi:hypothetical protein